MCGINYNFSAHGHTFSKGKGIYLFDDKGNKYYDLSMGSGVHILGHSNKKIVKAITKQATKLIVSQKTNKNNKSMKIIMDHLYFKRMKRLFYHNKNY